VIDPSESQVYAPAGSFSNKQRKCDSPLYRADSVGREPRTFLEIRCRIPASFCQPLG
jgi:hypothetical protein